MRARLYGILYPVVLMMSAVLCGCGHKDIVCPGAEPRPVAVLFMWDKAHEACVDGMTLYFYPLSAGGRMWRFDIAGMDGGAVELPVGRYRMLSVNNDLPGVTFSSVGSYETFEANARIASNGRAYPTGMLYAACVQDVEVTLCGVSYRLPDGSVKDCPMGVVRCAPDSVATVYDISLTNLKGGGNVRSITAMLSGIASSVIVATGSRGDSTCAVSSALEQVAATTWTGTTTGLGTPSGAPSFMLDIRVETTRGSIWSKRLDVTGQVTGCRNPRHVIIIVDGLEIPEDTAPDIPDGDVGIAVGVDGWKEIEIDLGQETCV